MANKKRVCQMMPAVSRIRCLLLAACLVGLAGCATIHLDVDVYKGPLANHEQVQTEQMAVMAVAAKPLLVRLREILEKNADDGFSTYDFGPYGNGYIDDYQFRDPDAAGVNDILSLYEDRTDTPLAKWTLAAQKAAWAYQNAHSRLDPEGPDKSREALESLNLSESKAQGLARAMRCTGATKDIESLIKHYKTFFCSRGDKPAKDIVQVSLNLEEMDCLPADLKKEIYAIRADSIRGRAGSEWMQEGKTSSNAAFRILSESGLARFHAKILFPDNKDNRKTFCRKVKSIAAAYLKARESMDLLLTSVLHLIVHNDCALNKDPDCKRTTDKLVDFAAGIIHFFQWQLRQQGLPLERNIENKFTGMSLKPHWEDAKNQFKSALKEDPYQVLQCHQGSKSPAPAFLVEIKALRRKNGVEKKVRESLTTEAGWEFGLARGPNKENFDTDKFLGRTLETALSGLGGIFHAGRHDLGLDTLIEDYIDASHKAPDPEDPDFEEARRKLQKALVRFAEKILFMADNVGLLKEHKSIKDIIIQDINKFTAVLQAVGNAILIQADEHAFRDAHKRRMDEEWRSEVAALEQSFFLSPSQVLSRIIQSLGSDAAQTAGRINALRKETDKITTDNNKKIEEKKKATARADKLRICLTPEELSRTAGRLKNSTPEIAVNGEKWLDEIISPLIAKLESHANNSLPSEGFCRHAELVAHGAERIIDRVVQSRKDFKEMAEKSRQATRSDTLNQLEPASRKIVEGCLLNLIRLDLQDPGTVLAALDTAQPQIEMIQKTAACACPAEKTGSPKPEGCPGSSTGTSLAKALGDAQKVLKELFGQEGNESLNKAWNETAVPALNHFEDACNTPAARDMFVRAQKDLEPVEKEIQALAAQIRQADKLVKGYAGKKTDLKKEETDLGTAIQIVSDYRKNWTPGPTGDPVIETLLARIIRDTADNNIEETHKEDLETTARLLKARQSLFPAVEKPVVSETDHDPRKILDKLIKSLNYQYIAAVAAGNEKSPESEKLRQAIEAARAYRSEMVYIRPASSYLRSSYASTSLQQDPGLKWQNLLGEHGLRNMPFIGPRWYNHNMGMGQSSYEIIAGIDKQFWQNINRVRVSGAGKTNYVIAKDDIGNWYVKNYAANPAPIIKGAKTLAAFSLGAGMETGLLNRIREARPGKPAGHGASLSPLEKLAVYHQSEYIKAAHQDLVSLYDQLKPIDGTKTGQTNSDLICDPSEGEEDNVLIRGLAQALFVDSNIKNEKAKVCDAIWTAAASTLKPAREMLEKAKGDPDRVKEQVAAIRKSGDKDLAGQLSPLLDAIVKAPGDTAGNAILANQAASWEEIRENRDLTSQIAELQTAIGDPEPAHRIIDALHDIRLFHSLLMRRMDKIPLNSPVEEDNGSTPALKKVIQKAQGIATSHLKIFLDKQIKKRRETLRAFEERMSVLGEAAGQEQIPCF